MQNQSRSPRRTASHQNFLSHVQTHAHAGRSQSSYALSISIWPQTGRSAFTFTLLQTLSDSQSSLATTDSPNSSDIHLATDFAQILFPNHCNPSSPATWNCSESPPAAVATPPPGEREIGKPSHRCWKISNGGKTNHSTCSPQR